MIQDQLLAIRSVPVRFSSLLFCFVLGAAMMFGPVADTFAQDVPHSVVKRKKDAADSGLTSRPLPNFAGVYPVLYQKIPAGKLTEAVGYLSGSSLISTPTDNISNSLTGRIAGLFTHQSSGEPGNDQADVSLRGSSPVVLIDGVPREIYSINPEQIKSVTVLKDALSTALLGIRGMNGAILITTRKGENSPGFNMDFTAQAGVSTPLKLPKPLRAYQYALLYNEALANDGLPPLYSPSDLTAYKDHSDPYGHPDVDWYDKILKKSAPFNRYTLDAAGASAHMHYFVSLDYLQQQGLLQGSSENTYSTNTNFKRFIFRSNVGVDLTPRVSMFINLFGRIRDQNEPGGGISSIITALQNTPANAYPVLNPDTTLGGNVNYSNNIYGQSVLAGYTKSVYSDGYADLGLKRSMDDILKGWWVKAMLSYNLTLNQLIDRSKTFETFQMLVDPSAGDTTYQRYGTKSDQKNASSVTDRDNQFYLQASTGYSHQFGHNSLDVMLLYNLDNYTYNSDLPDKYQTLSGKIQYSIRHKYLIEAVTSYSGNNRYRPGDQFGIFPAIGAGWNVSNEDFFNKSGFITSLKFRASYGLVGNAVAGYYDYIDRYGGATGYYFGTSAAAASGRAFKQMQDVTTWEKALKLDVGADMAVAKNRGMISVDYYRDRLNDLVETRQRSSALLGWGNNIVQNIGRNLYSGLEVTAGWSDKTAAFGYSLSGNFSISDSRVLFNDEPHYPYPWMQKQDNKVGQIYGYVADGFISKAGEGPVLEGYGSVPGDIRYKDLNNDGVINQFDEKPIGATGPLMFYGATGRFFWKNFGLSFLVQGVANRTLLLTGNQEWEFQNDGKGQAWQHNLDRWTVATASSASYPRLSVGTNVNNDVVSSFWIRSGDYLRLKNVELSYSFNDIRLGKASIRQLRLFLNGYNLLTSSKFQQTDPETLAGSYPVQRVVNGGITIKF